MHSVVFLSACDRYVEVRQPENLMCMDHWFTVIAAGCELSTGALQDLREVGFVVIPGPMVPGGLAPLVSAYDSAVACANADDLSEVVRPREFTTLSIAARNSTAYMYTNLSLRRVAASLASRSSSVHCWRGLCDLGRGRRVFMWTSSRTTRGDQ
jgi:hypothetical protein